MDGLSMLSKVIESGEPSSAMTLEGPLPRVFPKAYELVLMLMYIAIDMCRPDVPGKMLAPCETKIAGREFRAKEPLALLLFRWSTSVTVYALPIRAILSFIGFVHLDILRAGRLYRSMGILTCQCLGLTWARGWLLLYGERIPEWRNRQASFATGDGCKAVPRGCCGCRIFPHLSTWRRR